MKKSVGLNAVLNVIRTCIVIIVPLISFPYVSRVLSVSDLGKITFSNSLISYYSLIAAMGISTYAIREGAGIGDEDKKNHFISEVYMLNWFFTIIAYIAFAITFLCWKRLHDYSPVIIIQASTIFFTTLGLDWVNNIDEDFFYLTVRTIATQIISLLLIFVLVRNESDYIKYASISVAAVIAVNVLNFFYILKKHPLKKVNLRNTLTHIKPVIILFFNIVAITIYCNSDSTMLGIMNGNYDVGIYNMSAKIYSIMKSVFSAITAAALPRIVFYNGKDDKEEMRYLLNNVLHIILIILLPTIIGLILTSRDIISIIGGTKYAESVMSLKILSVSLFFALIANYLSTLILIPQKLERDVFWATLIGAIVNISLNIVILPRFGSVGAAVTTVIAELIVCIILLLYTKDKGFITLKSKDICAIFLGIIFEIVVIRLISSWFSNIILRMILNILLSCFIYFTVLFCLKESALLRIIKKWRYK